MGVFTCVAAATGEVLYSGTADAPELLATAENIILSEIAPSNTYYDSGSWVAIPAKPSNKHIWDWNSKSWVDPRVLSDFKEEKMTQLKSARNSAISSGFTWDGSTFDSDQVSQTRLLGLKVKAQGDPAMVETWRLQDNTWRQLNATDALAVWDTFEQHLRQAFQTFAVKEAAVLAAMTVEDVLAVTW